MRKSVLLVFVCLSLAACADRSVRRDAPAQPAPTILIALDGFRADYLDRGFTPTIAGIGRRGVRAKFMTPSYPALTFPNLYTIVTGLDPDRHGIVHNTIRDDVIGGKFSLNDRAAVADPRWWGGEPIWLTARKQGLRSATLFWVGSEAPIGGEHPEDWLPYDVGFAYPDRVELVLEWLSRPAATRPRFVTLYLELLDKAGHTHGPDSPEINAALVEADALIAQLLRGLDRRGLDANLIVVSDHGMAAISPQRTIILDDLFDPAHAMVVSTGEVITLTPRTGHEAGIEAALLRPHAHMRCWRKSELPARFRYGTHPRIPAIVCQTADGWVAGSREDFARRLANFPRGAHGFDNHSPMTRALFVADGPAVRNGVVLDGIEARDVYNVLAGAVGIVPAPNDGDAAVAARVLE